MSYGQLPGFACGADMESQRIPLPEAYTQTAASIVEKQLAKAGYRLAALLNRAFPD